MTSFIKSSPNSMVMEYWNLLRNIVYSDHKNCDEKIIRQHVMLSILLSITVVETFMNIYFRLLVSHGKFKKYEHTIINDLDNRMSLEKKLIKWPKLLFDREFDQSKGVGLEFKELKDLRNKLMHFTTTHETLKINDIEIHGLSDTSVFYNLKLEDCYQSESVAHRTMAEIIRLSGKTEEQVKAEMIHYTGDSGY